MITENKNPDDERNHGGLENKVLHNVDMDQDQSENNFSEQSKGDTGTPVDSGGVKSTELEPGLEEQWLAVRDEYLANYPDLEDEDTKYEQGSFHTVITRLANKTKRSTEEIQNEIRNWS